MEKPKKMGIGFGVMVLNDNNVLLGRRHPDPEKADSAMHGEGTWTMPGGKLDFGEGFEDGAVRELFEETGIRIDPKDLTLVSLTNDIVPDAHFVTVGLLYTKKVSEPEVKEPDEITEWKWFSLDSLPEPLFPPSRKVIERYLSKEIYKKP